MAERKYKVSTVKVRYEEQLFLAGLRYDVPLGQWTIPGTKRKVHVTCVGLHDRHIIGQIHPAALTIASSEVTSVAYYEE